MTSVDAAVNDALALLRALDGVARPEAQLRAAALAARHRPLELRLVPERNEHTGALDYGVLVRAPADETVYVTARRPSATPWLLHQVHDFREGTLLTVDGQPLSVGEAVAMFDELLEHTSVREQMIDACLVKRLLADDPPPVDDDELQDAVNEFRQRRGLLSAEATRSWMRAHGMSQTRVEAIAASAVRVRKLRRARVGGAVDDWFATHGHELARASSVRLRLGNVELARRALPRCTTLATLLALGEELLAHDLDTGDCGQRIESIVVHRGELPAADDAAIFARAGRVVGPLVSLAGVHLAWVSAIAPAHALDARTRDIVERRLFGDWLRAQREQSTIEWNWSHDDA